MAESGLVGFKENSLEQKRTVSERRTNYSPMVSTIIVARAIIPSPEHILTRRTCAENLPIFPVCEKLMMIPRFTVLSRCVSLMCLT